MYFLIQPDNNLVKKVSGTNMSEKTSNSTAICDFMTTLIQKHNFRIEEYFWSRSGNCMEIKLSPIFIDDDNLFSKLYNPRDDE